MPLAGTIVQDKYLDSVKLMTISKEIKARAGVTEAVAISASAENKAILKATDMLLPEFEKAPESSILIAILADTDEICQAAIADAKEHLNRKPVAREGSARLLPTSIESGLKSLPEANLALISVAGKHAAREAFKALNLGLHVMLFSDNVALVDELKLKQLAVSKELLMMGPDCGTAIINGVPLAFANKVRPGGIGIVSAAGTGLQAVCCEIHRRGEGISQAFGTGGRDGKKQIGGLMILQCLDFLMQDPATEVIVLICKLPDNAVIDRIMAKLERSDKPVVINFLSPERKQDLPNIFFGNTLSETAEKACRLMQDKNGNNGSRDDAHQFNNRSLVQLPIRPTRRYLRGLFSGGTLCYEAQLIFHRATGIHAFSNAPLSQEHKLENAWQSKEHTLIDMGADEFTVGRPHPMIDFSLRLKKLAEEMTDTDCAVILMDVVLGFGSHPKPQEELIPLIRQIKRDTCIVPICSVIGTDLDPQNMQGVIDGLREAGAIVTTSNSEACALAAKLILEIGRQA
ncbi:MAG: acyl-CoA synthetase FdrA [Candidatus Cloacimonadaceae bacterium]|nr:acyl-CoA synthetase FdrA [Candidatus Cloacimonadaceae bacterium]